MLRIRATLAVTVGVMLAAAAQAQQMGPPAMMPGGMYPPPMYGPAMGGPAMGGPMMGPQMGAPMGPMMGPQFVPPMGPQAMPYPPVVTPASFHGDYSPMPAGDSFDCGGGCDMGCSDYGCDDCFDCDCKGCGCDLCGPICPPHDCCPVIFNGQVEATILVPHLEGNRARGLFAAQSFGRNAIENFSSEDASLDDDHVVLSPRIWLHAQKCGFGIGGQVWHFDATDSELSQLNPNLLNAFGNFSQDRLSLFVTDSMLTYSERNHLLSGQLGVGFRYVDLEQETLAHGTAVLNDITAAASALARTDYQGYGVTSGYQVSLPLKHDAAIFWKLRGSYVWGDMSARSITSVNTTAFNQPNALFAGQNPNNGLQDETDNDLFIGEIQIGVEWQHDLVCIPARCFFRVAGEYQYWRFDDELEVESRSQLGAATNTSRILGQARATSGDLDLDLYGLSISSGITW